MKSKQNSSDEEKAVKAPSSAQSATSERTQKASTTPSTEASHTGALERVILRNNFYRDNYRRLVLICLGLIILSICLIFWGFYERNKQPAAQYFATTFDGKLIPLIPLSQPGITDNALLQWITEAAVASYSFNYVNYRKALQDSRIYFTKTGYEYFLKALSDSNNMNAVQSKKMIVSAIPTGAPVILKKGVYNDGARAIYTWEVQLPMEIDFRSATDLIKQQVSLNMRVVRVPTLESPQGVGIATYVLSEGKR